MHHNNSNISEECIQDFRTVQLQLLVEGRIHLDVEVQNAAMKELITAASASVEHSANNESFRDQFCVFLQSALIQRFSPD